MWPSFPIMLAELPAELAPAVSDYVVSFGIFVLVAIVPHFVAGKMLAGEKANIFKVLIALFFQTIVGLILWIVLGVTALFFGVPQNAALALSGILTTALLSLMMTGVYGFGIGSGFLYNATTIVVMTGILKVLTMSFELLPLKKVLAAAAVKMAETAGQRAAEAAGVRREQPAPRKPALAFSSVAEAQAAALKKYPELGDSRSQFNRRFLQIYARMKTEQPVRLQATNWPMVIADQVASEPGMR